MESDSRCHNRLLHFGLHGSAAEEGIEGIDVTVLLNHHSLELDFGNLHLTRLLREDNILAPNHGAVVAAVVVFHLQLGLTLTVNFLHMESVERRHLTGHLAHVHEGIELIGQEHSFLLKDTLLGGGDGNEYIIVRDALARALHAHTISLLAVSLSLTLSALTAGTVTARQHRNLRRSRLDRLTTRDNCCCRNLKSTCFVRSQRIGIGDTAG